MKRLVQHFSALTLMFCLLSAAPLFAQGKVDINTADATGLMSLKGIGEAKAKAIIKYRQMNGPFTSIDDLKSVPGVGDKIVSDNKSQIAVGQGMGKKAGSGKAKKEMMGTKDKAEKNMIGAHEKAKEDMAETKAKSKGMKGAASKSQKSMSGATDKAEKAMPKKQ